MKFGLVWDIADVLMGIMALINLPVILRLGGTAMRALSDYMKQRREGRDPVFKAKRRITGTEKEQPCRTMTIRACTAALWV